VYLIFDYGLDFTFLFTFFKGVLHEFAQNEVEGGGACGYRRGFGVRGGGVRYDCYWNAADGSDGGFCVWRYESCPYRQCDCHGVDVLSVVFYCGYHRYQRDGYYWRYFHYLFRKQFAEAGYVQVLCGGFIRQLWRDALGV
jgi:hypothetical protein